MTLTELVKSLTYEQMVRRAIEAEIEEAKDIDYAMIETVMFNG